MDFGRAGGRRVVADFRWRNGFVGRRSVVAGRDGQGDRVDGSVAACFADRRNPLMTVHALGALVA